MLRLHQIKLPLDGMSRLDGPALKRLCAARLGVPIESVRDARLKKRSVDARKGACFTLTVDVVLAGEKEERRTAARFKPNEMAYLPGGLPRPAPDVMRLSAQPWPKDAPRPLVVGAGPAGLFCALALCRRGARPIVIDRGQPVEKRARDVEAIEAEGLLNEESNVLFGEGGAGAFSDGKLTCGLNSPQIQTVLQTLVRYGAPEEILLSQRPHIGTDVLRGVLKRLRAALIAGGAQVRFGCKLTGLILRSGRVAAARVLENGAEDEIVTDHVYLAIGHSARDTYEWLCNLGLPMQQKPFAMGVRIEHLQQSVNRAQYGDSAGHPALPPAEYKLNVPTPDGRGVYTFCMCPGGQVINVSSEAGGVAVNGMSLHARNGQNANAAVLVGVRPRDFGGEGPLAGVALQRSIERAAYRLTGSLKAPCQRVGDFLAGQKTTRLGDVTPTYRPGVVLSNLNDVLPGFLHENLRLALPGLGQRLHGFDHPDALLTGPETRSSSPLRMLRNQRRESPIGGLYPLGEGAGYAGGIVSAAVDGLCAALDLESERSHPHD